MFAFDCMGSLARLQPAVAAGQSKALAQTLPISWHYATNTRCDAAVLCNARHANAAKPLQGETAEEVAGLAKAMRDMGVAVHPQGDVLDIVGTGGDGIGSVNISTGASVIAAAAGAKVAKHGNRSVSSLCGSADVLEVGHLQLLLPSLSGGLCSRTLSAWSLSHSLECPAKPPATHLLCMLTAALQ